MTRDLAGNSTRQNGLDRVMTRQPTLTVEQQMKVLMEPKRMGSMLRRSLTERRVKSLQKHKTQSNFPSFVF